MTVKLAVLIPAIIKFTRGWCLATSLKLLSLSGQTKFWRPSAVNPISCLDFRRLAMTRLWLMDQHRVLILMETISGLLCRVSVWGSVEASSISPSPVHSQTHHLSALHHTQIMNDQLPYAAQTPPAPWFDKLRWGVLSIINVVLLSLHLPGHVLGNHSRLCCPI